MTGPGRPTGNLWHRADWGSRSLPSPSPHHGHPTKTEPASTAAASGRSRALAPVSSVSYSDTMNLSGRLLRTLCAVFEHPARADLAWADIETLLRALGAGLSEGRGSRVRIYLNGVRAVFHRPHPQKETSRAALRSMRRFLTEAGIVPQEDDR